MTLPGPWEEAAVAVVGPGRWPQACRPEMTVQAGEGPGVVVGPGQGLGLGTGAVLWWAPRTTPCLGPPPSRAPRRHPKPSRGSVLWGLVPWAQVWRVRYNTAGPHCIHHQPGPTLRPSPGHPPGVPGVGMVVARQVAQEGLKALTALVTLAKSVGWVHQWRTRAPSSPFVHKGTKRDAVVSRQERERGGGPTRTLELTPSCVSCSCTMDAPGHTARW